ncbi:MAG: hypothetical protein KAR47_14730 [Planctomycetes bacterium]|nr:hypothetical protein [Planctomycetota bacterium]
MSRARKRKTHSRLPEQLSRRLSHAVGADADIKSLDNDIAKERYIHIAAIALLLLFGAYLSWLYFGHQVVPNPDFPGFVRVAESLLAFEVPGNFKRAPVLGLLMVPLGKLMPGLHPVLTAGWLLNAVFYIFNGLLFYLIAKRFIGKSAVWPALLIMVNPWSVAMLVQPLVETTLVFFFLLTFFFILRRSSWAYLFAAIATMARYEGAALIVVAFVMDMICAKDNRKRIKALIFAGLASVPLVLWVTGIYLASRGASAGPSAGAAAGAAAATGARMHYISGFFTGRTVFAQYADLLWKVTFGPLLMATGAEAMSSVEMISKVFVVISLLVTVVFASYKRKWDVLSLLLFFVLFVLVHSLRSTTRDRYCMPVVWLGLLLFWYGFQTGLGLLGGVIKPPQWIKNAFQIILAVGFSIWLISLFKHLSAINPYSQRSVSVPFVGMAVVVILLSLQVFFYRSRFLPSSLAMSALICLMIVSNQFTLVKLAGNGQLDAEFKYLADWYLENAKGEKIVTTMPSVIRLFAPEYAGNFIQPSKIRGETPTEFVQDCYKKGITYVTWDSRIGYSNPNGKYYRLWGIKRIAPLAGTNDLGPYEYITQLKASERRFVNIFRLRTAPQE